MRKTLSQYVMTISLLIIIANVRIFLLRTTLTVGYCKDEKKQIHESEKGRRQDSGKVSLTMMFRSMTRVGHKTDWGYYEKKEENRSDCKIYTLPLPCQEG